MTYFIDSAYAFYPSNQTIESVLKPITDDIAPEIYERF